MKKIFYVFMTIVSAICLSLMFTSCSTNDEYEEILEEYKYSEQDYNTMYDYVTCLYDSGLFSIEKPNSNTTYKQLIISCASVIMTDEFGDTFAEGYCYNIYCLVYDYYIQYNPNAKVVYYIKYLLDNDLY